MLGSSSIKRAPSPRVIRNIVNQFLRSPKDWDERKWSTIHTYFNFDAEHDSRGTYSAANVRTEAARQAHRFPGEADTIETTWFHRGGLAHAQAGDVELAVGWIEAAAQR